ncbi:MAG: sugar transporter [Pseudomonadota bacterium]
MRRRHGLLLVSLLIMVMAPMGAIIWYLNEWAEDQYASEMSFSIRSEEFVNPLEALNGLGQLSTGTTADAEVVYEFIASQKIVRSIDAELGLRALYSAPQDDPVFTISADVPVEELLRHWRWMVQANLDKGSGLINVKSFAFDPKSAKDINDAILRQSQDLVDMLSFQAREDATKYAKADLEEARERLKRARQNLSQFRAESQLIDPTIDVQSQGGVSAALQQQLAEAMIDLDLLEGSTSNRNDTRLEQARRRIEAIRNRLEGERASLASEVDRDMVAIVGSYEALIVEREFAEQAFLSAAAAFDSARADAKRRTKYLAVHIEPTLADAPLYPRAILISVMSAALLVLVWSVFLMVAYSIRDRR